MAEIQNDQVVSFHYTLTDENGTVIDKSEGQPLVYLHGAGNIIPGLENALTGKTVGEKLNVNVPAAEGYGEYNAQLVQEVPRNMFQGVDDIQAGMQFQAQTDDGIQIVTVKDVTDENVIVDGNHPLAGQNLNFDVEIVDIRPASQEELDHGHVHGAGGHQH
ncbi:peptidylprolyl isomerase [Alkanindiges sp. WGS2144]|uniref:peptidylprolyl isomerase n=1 Tax=Alkanindiges sp. WGS2144 TaxID=3366808 RepID=UPI0037517EE8